MERDFSDERRLSDDVKDMARRLHTLEDQYANLPGVHQTGVPVLPVDDEMGAASLSDDHEKRLASVERSVKRLQARVKDVETADEPDPAPGL